MSILNPQKHSLHFIGIGGVGMSALAIILAKRGYSVSGSDKKSQKKLDHLREIGIKIFPNQVPSNIETISKGKKHNLVIISTAVDGTNEELKAAVTNKIEIWHRSELLASLIKQQKSIAVAGTHGKTTTTTFLSTLLAIAEKDPTSIVGGEVPIFETNGHNGKGELLVAEADESDGSIVRFKADISLITNIELDHADFYKNLQSLINTMQIFSNNSRTIIANFDCKNCRKNINASYWWSTKTNKNVNFAAIPIKQGGDYTFAEIFEEEKSIGKIKIPVGGSHNLQNAIGAIAACRVYGINYNIIFKGVTKLARPKRRFEIKGTWQNRLIIDDYAHHPSEIIATIEMANLLLKSDEKYKKLIIVFQPHRYSRIKKFIDEFAKSFFGVDTLILTPIYAAGESPKEEITSKFLANKIKAINSELKVHLINEDKSLLSLLEKHTSKNDLIITMGAGDINKIWEQLINNESNDDQSHFLDN